MSESLNEKSHLAEFFDSWPYIAAIIDEEGKIIHVNEKWQENAVNSGCSLEVCGPGVNYLEVALNAVGSQEGIAREAAAGIKEVLNGKKAIYRQRYSNCYDQEEKWFEMKVKPFQQGALIIHEDITEYKKEEQRYENLYNEYETLFKNLQSGVALIEIENGDFYYEKINPYHRKLGGAEIEPEMIRGKTPDELLRKDIADKTREHLQRCKETKQSIVYEEQLELPSGKKHLQTKLSPVIIEDRVEKIVGIFHDITAQKRLERELKNLNYEYETILDNSQSAIFLLDVEDEKRITFQRLNDTEEELTGLSTEEVKGKTPVEVLGKDTGKEVEANYRKCLKKREATTYEEELNLPAGKKTWLTRLTPVILDGKVEKIVGSSLDITELKVEKLWSDALFKDGTSAIARVGKTGEIIDINQKFNEIFGYELSEIKGENLDDVLERGKEGSVNRKKTGEVLEGEKIKFEGKRFDKDGNPREFLIKGIPVKMDGEVRGIYAVFDDITETKRQQKKLEAIFSASKNVSFIITEPEGKQNYAEIIEFSPGAENIFGYEKEEVLEKPVSMLYPEETEDNIANMHEKIYKGESWQSKIKLQRKNGKKFTAMLNVHPFTSPQGQTRSLGVAIDINELEKTREKLEYISYHDELTGLYNRKFMEENMDRLDTERQLPISLIMLDINGLKIINDTFGHEMGDRLLKRTAEILQESIRQEDILARWAGDEFVIMLPQTARSEAEKIVKRIEKRCHQTYRKDCGKDLKEAPPVSLGKGLAIKTDSQQEMEDILKLADEKMYQDKRKNGHSAKREMINCLVQRLYENSSESENHALRVTRLALQLGEKIGLNEKEQEDLAYLGSLHDIGELAIDKGTLKKSDELDEEEWKKIKEHPGKGAKFVAPMEELSHLTDIIKFHHEAWNGEGYPTGQKKENIPLKARIFAICDAYDVMTNSRPYKEPMSKEEALEEIEECAGSQFDPELAKKFVEMIRSDELDEEN